MDNYLSNIKSSGIYRFVWDKSEIPGVEAETLRLVVGYSEKGPFNTPVYVKSANEFKTIFGNRSKKLERNGVWFHRMAIQALAKGPILALNLKPFKDEEVEGVSFDPNQQISNIIKLKINEIYNVQRFWKLEPELLQNIESSNNDELPRQHYINITATDTFDLSNTIFMRGFRPNGFDITFKDYFNTALNGEDIPEYILKGGHENDLLSNYFAEIFVFQGEFTAAIASSERLNRYFNIEDGKVSLKPYVMNAFGEKVDTLYALAGDEASNFIKSYTGIILPEFLNTNKTILSLDDQFNNDQRLHKMMMRLNQDMLYNDEFVLTDLDTTGFLGDGHGQMSLTAVSPVVYAYDPEKGYIKQDNGDQPDEANYYEYSIGGVEDTPENRASKKIKFYYKPEDVVATPSSNVISDIELDLSKAGLQIGDIFMGEKGYVTLNSLEKIEEKDEEGKITKTTWTMTFSGNVKAFGGEVKSTNDTRGINLPGGMVPGGCVWGAGPDNPHGCVVYYAGSYSIRKIASPISYTSANMVPTYIKGYSYKNGKPKANNNAAKIEWQHLIMDTVKIGGMIDSLTNRVDVDYRYLVDTFEGYVENECKSRLAEICKQKDNTFGILNFPAMKTFEKCDYTSFTDGNGVFNTKFIPTGGNRQKSMGTVFTLPAESNGASWVAFYTPVIIRDAQTGIKDTCPSAALVSNNYMDKYTKYQPYTIIAGPNRGVLINPELIGPDFNYSRKDLDNLEPFGVNCLVFVPGRGTYINSNQTAKQNPVTSLSKAHVRELCIFLQDEIEKLLQQYHWDFNTPNLRSTIKDRADVILETAKNNGGVYEYLNVCDTSNNTDEVINNEMFILSTSIEPTMGAGKMVQELTLYRKGGMSSLISE